MRTVAGQINGFNFSSFAANGDNPAQGFLETNFKDEWASQMTLPTGVLAENIGGNEHFGAVLQFPPALPDIAVDLPLPPGAVLGYAYSVSQIYDRVNAIWTNVLKGMQFDDDGNTVTSGGSTTLQGLSITANASSWTTTLTASYHIGFRLPDVSVKIQRIESFQLFPGSVPASFTVSYFPSELSFDADIRELESVLAVLAATVGPFVILASLLSGILSIYGKGLLESDVIGKVQQAAAKIKAKPVTNILNLLGDVYGSIPQRIKIPDTVDDMWLDYDSMSTPQGTIAATVRGNLEFLAPQNSAILFSGRRLPVRARRIGWVAIIGSTSVQLPFPTGTPGASSTVPFEVGRQYTLLFSDEAVNPKFTWSIDTHSAPSVHATLSSPATEPSTATVTFSVKGVLPSTEKVFIRVQMDDDLHLKNEQGQSPSAVMMVTVSQDAPVSTPKPGGVIPRILPG
ncbi:hypothetical protein [Caballeronia mineralivorans]|uniref:hypothetical protein n=1 Tax=Caballeronia mineralivorans TaxID=2010198 RepID=UPI0023F349C3|nr:hypothetical protein [Caballeronia mineralivorans]MDB5785170.1 hypothetical protein [Caballeronia mineralivorans]